MKESPSSSELERAELKPDAENAASEVQNDLNTAHVALIETEKKIGSIKARGICMSERQARAWAEMLETFKVLMNGNAACSAQARTKVYNETLTYTNTYNLARLLEQNTITLQTISKDESARLKKALDGHLALLYRPDGNGSGGEIEKSEQYILKFLETLGITTETLEPLLNVRTKDAVARKLQFKASLKSLDTLYRANIYQVGNRELKRAIEKKYQDVHEFKLYVDRIDPLATKDTDAYCAMMQDATDKIREIETLLISEIPLALREEKEGKDITQEKLSPQDAALWDEVKNKYGGVDQEILSQPSLFSEVERLWGRLTILVRYKDRYPELDFDVAFDQCDKLREDIACACPVSDETDSRFKARLQDIANGILCHLPTSSQEKFSHLAWDTPALSHARVRLERIIAIIEKIVAKPEIIEKGAGYLVRDLFPDLTYEDAEDLLAYLEAKKGEIEHAKTILELPSPQDDDPVEEVFNIQILERALRASADALTSGCVLPQARRSITADKENDTQQARNAKHPLSMPRAFSLRTHRAVQWVVLTAVLAGTALGWYGWKKYKGSLDALVAEQPEKKGHEKKPLHLPAQEEKEMLEKVKHIDKAPSAIPVLNTKEYKEARHTRLAYENKRAQKLRGRIEKQRQISPRAFEQRLAPSVARNQSASYFEQYDFSARPPQAGYFGGATYSHFDGNYWELNLEFTPVTEAFSGETIRTLRFRAAPGDTVISLPCKRVPCKRGTAPRTDRLPDGASLQHDPRTGDYQLMLGSGFDFDAQHEIEFCTHEERGEIAEADRQKNLQLPAAIDYRRLDEILISLGAQESSGTLAGNREVFRRWTQWVRQHIVADDSETITTIFEKKEAQDFLNFMLDHPRGDCDVINSIAILGARRMGIPVRLHAGVHDDGSDADHDGWSEFGYNEGHGWFEAVVDDRWEEHDCSPLPSSRSDGQAQKRLTPAEREAIIRSLEEITKKDYAHWKEVIEDIGAPYGPAVEALREFLQKAVSEAHAYVARAKQAGEALQAEEIGQLIDYVAGVRILGRYSHSDLGADLNFVTDRALRNLVLRRILSADLQQGAEMGERDEKDEHRYYTGLLGYSAGRTGITAPVSVSNRMRLARFFLREVSCDPRCTREAFETFLNDFETLNAASSVFPLQQRLKLFTSFENFTAMHLVGTEFEGRHGAVKHILQIKRELLQGLPFEARVQLLRRTDWNWNIPEYVIGSMQLDSESGVDITKLSPQSQLTYLTENSETLIKSKEALEEGIKTPEGLGVFLTRARRFYLDLLMLQVSGAGALDAFARSLDEGKRIQESENVYLGFQYEDIARVPFLLNRTGVYDEYKKRLLALRASHSSRWLNENALARIHAREIQSGKYSSDLASDAKKTWGDDLLWHTLGENGFLKCATGGLEKIKEYTTLAFSISLDEMRTMLTELVARSGDARTVFDTYQFIYAVNEAALGCLPQEVPSNIPAALRMDTAYFEREAVRLDILAGLLPHEVQSELATVHLASFLAAARSGKPVSPQEMIFRLTLVKDALARIQGLPVPFAALQEHAQHALGGVYDFLRADSLDEALADATKEVMKDFMNTLLDISSELGSAPFEGKRIVMPDALKWHIKIAHQLTSRYGDTLSPEIWKQCAGMVAGSYVFEFEDPVLSGQANQVIDAVGAHLRASPDAFGKEYFSDFIKKHPRAGSPVMRDKDW